MSGIIKAPGGARGLIGKENWLFLVGDSNDVFSELTGRQIMSDEAIARYGEVFRQRKSTFDALGIPYFFFVAPTKEMVYEDRLPHGYDIIYETFPSTPVLRVAREAGVPGGYLREVVKAARSGGEVYYRTDTHWNLYGGHAAYAEVHRQLSEVMSLTPVIEWDAVKLTEPQPYRGDLANKVKMVLIPDAVPRFLEVAEGAIPVSDYDETFSKIVSPMNYKIGEVADYLKVSPTRDTVVHETEDSSLPTAMVFRDSFALALMPYLSNHFSRIVYVWKPEPNFDLIAKEKPDVVININLDRFLRLVPTR
ncbi:alginate O-acetyltransferase AlgX-related protein [Pararhizobium gei]|uniref:alginate O-acetyltransferase AlgX-related protein n=1 Tax=Pararhizobium gei TaxID=1395951 RepID=UPI0023DB1B30|nr:hypothetical protein [Rhizobium gei]